MAVQPSYKKQVFEMCIRFEAKDVAEAKIITQFQAHKLGGTIKSLGKVVQPTTNNKGGRYK